MLFFEKIIIFHFENFQKTVFQIILSGHLWHVQVACPIYNGILETFRWRVKIHGNTLNTWKVA